MWLGRPTRPQLAKLNLDDLAIAFPAFTSSALLPDIRAYYFYYYLPKFHSATACIKACQYVYLSVCLYVYTYACLSLRQSMCCNSCLSAPINTHRTISITQLPAWSISSSASVPPASASDKPSIHIATDSGRGKCAFASIYGAI